MPNKFTSTASAIAESSRNFLAANPYVGIVAALLLLFVIVLFSGRSCSSSFEEREAEREKERQALIEKARTLEERANISEERARLLGEQNRQLIQVADSLRQTIAGFKQERVIIREKYAAKNKEIDSITDADELHRRNCVERAKLGFPCAN